MTGQRLTAWALVVALAAAACGSGGGTTATEPRLATVGAARFAEVVNGGSDRLVILDVRTPEEFAAGHIPGAINLDYYLASFPSDLAALDRDAEYAVYCRSGNRSGETLSLMEELGFASVSHLGGGVIDWYESGFPLER
jgi:rhodanese-related sulfurtransferase